MPTSSKSKTKKAASAATPSTRATKAKAATSTKAVTKVSQGSLASNMVERIESLQEELGLGEALTAKQRAKNLIGLRAPDALLDAAAAFVDTHGNIGVTTFDSTKARDSVARVKAFSPAITSAQTFAQAISDNVHGPRAEQGRAALDLYAALEGLVRTTDGKKYLKQFQAMKAIMRTGKRAKATDPSGGGDASPPPAK